PHRFNDSTRWRGIYEVDFGTPDSSAYEVWNNGQSDVSYSKIAIMRRDQTLSGSDNVIIFMTSHGSADFTDDSVLYNHGAAKYEINADGDTSITAASSAYYKPYTGRMWVENAPAAPPTPGQRIKIRKP
ncbi:hypothetical protein KAR91_71225, partial [Candidatus Pacearchaeota archaeon]|nr:hypothetical protein [Candidatus Pacearchaeota archaeon]